MVETVCVTNQKGGVGKTTTSISLGAALAGRGARVTVVDLDPQGNASTGLGVARGHREVSIRDVLEGTATLGRAAQKTLIDGLSIVPATVDLGEVEGGLGEDGDRLRRLRASVDDLDSRVDYVLIDCPPALGFLTRSALVASDAVLVPLQAEFFALEGLSQLLQTVKRTRSGANRTLRLSGIVLTMFDGRNNICRQVEEDVRAALGDLVYRTRIPRNVRLSEAPSHGQTVFQYAPRSRGAYAYTQLCMEVLQRD